MYYKEYQQRYYKENRTRIRLQKINRRRILKGLEPLDEKGDRERRENIKRRIAYRLTHRRTPKINRLQVFVELGGEKCKRCGFSDRRALQIDHIGGGGTREIEKFKGAGSSKYFKHILANKDKYQVLCANCNWIKRVENKELSKNQNTKQAESST